MNILKALIEWFEKHKKISTGILVIILLTMSYFSSIPGSTLSFGSIWPSIIYHFSIFATFSFFLIVVIRKKKLEKKTIIITVIISLIVAILDEFHQLFVPLRSASIQDILIDLTGILCSVGIYSLIKKIK